MKNVLWLVSWYPNRLDKFDGDFIQRHARAVSLYCRVHVIYVKKDASLPANSPEVVISNSENLTEEIIYYNSSKTGIGFLDRYISFRHYKQHYRKAIGSYIEKQGKPQLMHVHVAMKSGVAALWASKKWDLPYVVSEHWTAYLKEADERIEHQSYIFKRLLAKVVSGASVVTVVSDHLGKSMQWYFPRLQYRVIPNVVDTRLFYPLKKETNPVPRFIHISNLNFQKQVDALLEACRRLKQEYAFELYIYGPSNGSLRQKVDESGLNNEIFLMGEHPQKEISHALRRSDALILYSRFETFGCVIIEANACGVPAIVSDHEVFHELIVDGENGVFVKPGSVDALANTLNRFIDGWYHFDAGKIAASAAVKYSFEKVGRDFFNLYQELSAGAAVQPPAET